MGAFPPSLNYLSKIEIEDELSGLSEIKWDDEDKVKSLAPGEKVIATATYTLTAQDLQNGSLANSAAVIGKAPSGDEVRSDVSTATTKITPKVIPAAEKIVEEPVVLPATGYAFPASIIAILAIISVILLMRRKRKI